MKNVNASILSASDAANQNGIAVNANQLVSGSFQINFGADSHAAGTFQLQASNDPFTGIPQSGFVPTNWSDIPDADATITSGSSAIVLLSNMAYQWIRATWTNTANYKEVTTITAVHDVTGSLKSTYFTFNSIDSVTGAVNPFYVWYDNGSGVDPAIPDATGIQVVYSDDATASTIGGLTRTALGSLTGDVVITGATDTIIITNVTLGAVDPSADGSAATGFNFVETNAGVDAGTVTCMMNGLSV